MSKHGAVPTMLGFDYQKLYALKVLLGYASQGNTAFQVALEECDDIDVFDDSGQRIRLIQTKYHLFDTTKKRSCISSSSTDFWGTLQIWIDGINDNTIDIDTIDEFVLATTAQVGSESEDTFIGLLCDLPKDSRDNYNILQKILSIAKDYKTKLETKQQQSNKNNKASIAFLGVSKDIQSKLVEKMYILTKETDLDGLKNTIKQFYNTSISDDNRAKVSEDLISDWLGNKCLTMVTNGEKASMEWVYNKIEELRERYKKDALPYHIFQKKYTPELFDSYNNSVFVDKLNDIELDDREISFAIHDFVCAYEFRSECLNKGLSSIDYENSYQGELYRRWERRYSTMLRQQNPTARNTNPPSDIDAGKDFYDELVTNETNPKPYKEQTEGVDITYAGSLHLLAEQDLISWYSKKQPIVYTQNLRPNFQDATKLETTINNTSTPL